MDYRNIDFFDYTRQLLSHCLLVKMQHFHRMDQEFITSQVHGDYVPMLVRHLLPSMMRYHEVCEMGAICFITTAFHTKYLILCLSENDEGEHVSIGPFLDVPITDDDLYQVIRRMHLSLEDASKLRMYYQSVPTYDEDSVYEILCTIYGQFMVGASVGGSLSPKLPRRITLDLSTASKEDSSYDIRLEEMNRNTMYKMLENRYELEEQLLAYIMNGDEGKAQQFWRKHPFSTMELNRTRDSVRNAKNLILVANTLFRKAAYQGGVHPIYLDELSGKWATRIEQEGSLEALQALPPKMLRSYCLLTRNHSLSGYSPVVQRALNFIHLNLSSQLTVGKIAAEVGLSPDYLTRVCKKELGCSLTTYVNQMRVEASVKLLNTTNLAVEDIGDMVGFGSSSYFYSQFRKIVGMSPRKYRDGVK